LGIDLADYALLMSDAGQLLPSTEKILGSIMHEEEKKNVLAYRDKFPPERACNILRVNFFFFPFLEILKNSAFARATVIPYTTRNYRN
jgi:hypothetical protein